jgi:hypothetical protein
MPFRMPEPSLGDLPVAEVLDVPSKSKKELFTDASVS